jgi:rubrerythrin
MGCGYLFDLVCEADHFGALLCDTELLVALLKKEDIMTKKETLTALEIAKIACNIENDGSDFYEAAAADTKAKRLFKELADKQKDA